MRNRPDESESENEQSESEQSESENPQALIRPLLQTQGRILPPPPIPLSLNLFQRPGENRQPTSSIEQLREAVAFDKFNKRSLPIEKLVEGMNLPTSSVPADTKQRTLFKAKRNPNLPKLLPNFLDHSLIQRTPE